MAIKGKDNERKKIKQGEKGEEMKQEKDNQRNENVITMNYRQIAMKGESKSSGES